MENSGTESRTGKKANGSLTDNWVKKIDALLPKYDPKDRHKNNPLLQQIVNNTGSTAQNTAGLAQQTGDEVGGHLKSAMLEIIGVSLRQSSRDNFYNARRA